MYPSPGIHDRDNELKLDPGIPARRNSSSGCRCILTIILVTIGLVVALFIGQLSISIFQGVREPQAALLYKTNSLDLVDPAAVVRPLIDERQTFDIVATVWLRTNDSNAVSDKLNQNLDDTNHSIVSTLPTERAIFTGTVFQGLRLKDKEIRATIEYKVPTEIFKSRDLNHYDLRASFVLIPTSPSLLDHLTNYSSWRNETIIFPSFRSWPETGPPPTLKDQAIDSFGVSMGLVTFLGVHSRCDLGISAVANASQHALSESDIDDDDSDDSDDGGSSKPSKNGHSQSEAYPSPKGKPVLESHPYIISRSDIIAVDMTKLYDRKLYNQAHKKLKATACSLELSPPNHDWKLCHTRRFGKYGNMDTRLQLKMAEGEDVNKVRTHWAYAPYLTLAETAWTSKDLVPVPVNREDCTKGGRFNTSEPLSRDEEFVDITWKIVYSGRTPAKLRLSEGLKVPAFLNMTDTDVNRQKAQSGSELIQGLRGHRLSEDRHPRRIFFVGVLIPFIKIVRAFLNVHYWYTRSSTIGISRFAITLIAATTLGKYLLTAFFGENGIFPMLMTMITLLPFQSTPFLMMKVVWRIEFGWEQNKRNGKVSEKERIKRQGRICLPSFGFMKATHRERASDRLDGSISWTLKLSLFISCCLAYFLLSPATSFPIPPLGLPQVDKFWLRKALLHSLIYPAFIVGSGLQLWFNHQSRTFAGSYKLSVILQGVETGLALLTFSTRVFGNRDVREGFSVHDLVTSIMVAVWCWQAAMLPKVAQWEVDDEPE